MEKLEDYSEVGFPLLHQDEIVEIQVDNVEMALEHTPEGQGTLLLTTDRVMWFNQKEKSGIQIQYKNTIVHAISTDPELYEKPCIYVQLACDSESEDDETDASEDEEVIQSTAQGLHEVSQVKFAPTECEPTKLKSIFDAFSKMSALHLDTDAENDEDEIDMDQFYTADNLPDWSEGEEENA